MIVKIAICLLSTLALSSAGYGGGGGHSNTFRKQDDYGNYAFGYDIVDPHGAKNFRKESGDAWGNKVGSYGLYDVDGRLRIVDYVADKHGFRAKIKTNEPGTANKDSAAAIVNGPDHAGYSGSHIPAGKTPPQFNEGPVHDGGHGAHAYSGPGPIYAAPTTHSHGYGHGHGHHAPAPLYNDGPSYGHGDGHGLYGDGHGLHGDGLGLVAGHGGHGYGYGSPYAIGGPIGAYSHHAPYFVPYFGY